MYIYYESAINLSQLKMHFFNLSVVRVRYLRRAQAHCARFNLPIIHIITTAFWTMYFFWHVILIISLSTVDHRHKYYANALLPPNVVHIKCNVNANFPFALQYLCRFSAVPFSLSPTIYSHTCYLQFSAVFPLVAWFAVIPCSEALTIHF